MAKNDPSPCLAARQASPKTLAACAVRCVQRWKAQNSPSIWIEKGSLFIWKVYQSRVYISFCLFLWHLVASNGGRGKHSASKFISFGSRHFHSGVVLGQGMSRNQGPPSPTVFIDFSEPFLRCICRKKSNVRGRAY